MRDSQTSHFWLGHFPDEQRVADYFAEVYDAEDEDREHTPLSKFARDQEVKWYDHDFLEHGHNPAAGSVEKLVAGHSYHEQWTAELVRRAAAASINGANTLVFIDCEEIARPRSVTGDGYALHYLGTIRYRI